MEAVLKRPAWPQSSETLRSFGNWLLCWILIPNAGFWLLWFIGGPPRAMEILITGTIGLALHRAPFALKFAGFVIALIRSVLAFISGMFNLAISSLFFSLGFALELDPLKSPHYVIAALAVAAMLMLAWKYLRQSTALRFPTLFLAALCLVLTAAYVDQKVAMSSQGSYKRTPQAGTPFTSATTGSGLDRLATGERHVLMVMVEAMGQPTDPALRRQLQDIWARPEVRAQYDVTFGDTLYYGSTTVAEIRELCGRWGDYQELRTRKDPSCLPATLAANGYRSQAWHSFTGEFFDRTSWYPNIGFDRMRFGDELQADGAARCPGIFPGACDWDVPSQISAELRHSEQPQFIYWLTVNSHLPVIKSEHLRTKECAGFDARLDADYPMICRLHQIFDHTGAALAKEITASDFPATDILIVGDHIPPFLDRHHREQFAGDRVPWILLRPKAGRGAAAAL